MKVEIVEIREVDLPAPEKVVEPPERHAWRWPVIMPPAREIMPRFMKWGSK